MQKFHPKNGWLILTNRDKGEDTSGETRILLNAEQKNSTLISKVSAVSEGSTYKVGDLVFFKKEDGVAYMDEFGASIGAVNEEDVISLVTEETE